MNQTVIPDETKPLVTPVPASPNSKAREAVSEIGSKAASAKDKLVDEALKFKDQAATKASEYAIAGKDKASDALDSLSRLIRDAAGSVDTRLGENYGQYTRKTADVISTAATSLREKEFAAIAEDTREFVRKSPVIAIGVAAAAGFVLARLLKSGGSANDANT